MNENEIKGSYECLDTDANLDLRVIAVAGKKITEQSAPKNNRRKYRRFAIAMALVVSVVGAFQIPEVSSYAQSVLKKVGNYVNIFHMGGASEDVKMEGTYVQIKSDASHDFQSFNTLSHIEEELGIQLLKVDNGTEGENSWDYDPTASGGKKLYEISLRNSSYILGDLGDVNLVGGIVANEEYKAAYKKGKEFKSPIICEITIRTEKYKVPRDVRYTRDIESAANAQKVYCENLGVDVVLAYNQSDGLAVWGDMDIKRMTFMYFFYEGIGYSFAGDVSYKTMLKIAESLHY